MILSHGRVLIEGLKREITAEESPVYHIATKGHALQLHVVEGIEVHRNDGYEADFAVSRPGAEQEVVRQALHEGELVEFARRQTSLSDVYRRVAQ